MATLLLWLGFQPGAIDEVLWMALERRALARAPGVATRYRAECARALAITHRRGAPAPLRLLANGSFLLADLSLDADSSTLSASAQDLPAAVAHVDPLAGRLRLLRDRLGQRALVWTRLRDGVLVASGEHILLAHPCVSKDWDRDYLAAYFGASAPPVSATIFRTIHALAPGERLDVDASSQRSFISPIEPERSLIGWSDAAVTDRFRHLLRAAVEQDTQDAARVGVSLSAGLDSCSVAALLPSAQRSRALTLTYGCSQIEGLDERPLAEQLSRHLGIEHQGFAIDSLAPLMPTGMRPVCPDTPISNPYREVKSELYRRARAAGMDVLLTGHFADHLQADARYWLRSAWRHGAYRLILQRYAGLLRQGGPLAVWRERGWRHWLAGSKQGGRPVAWLRPEWQETLIANRNEAVTRCLAWPQPAQAAHALGSYAAIDAAGENFFAAAQQIEVRHPYRQVDLVRFALSLPGHYSERAGQRKWVVREALRGILPAPWRDRPKTTSMQPLFDASLFGTEYQRAEELIASGRPYWSDFVDPAALVAAQGPGGDESAGLLRWLLVGFGLWLAAQDD